MTYAFAQGVVDAETADVVVVARRLVRRLGLTAGPLQDPGGFMSESVLPLADGGRTGRLWVWGLAPGLSAVYLGLEDRSVAARLPIGAWLARRRLERQARQIVDGLRRERQTRRVEERIAA